MGRRSTQAAAHGVLACVTACLVGCHPSGTCIKFDDVAAQTTYNVGAVAATSGANINVEQFTWISGSITTNGTAMIDATNHAGGTQNAMHTNNVNLRFTPGQHVTKVTMKFADLGGNENLTINGAFANIAKIVDLNNTTLGGVQVSVHAVLGGPGAQPNNWYGTIKLTGPITGFSIGGQELWIDDVCWE